MAGETVITVVGNLIDDPELRFTPSGAAVANFRSPRRRAPSTKQTNEWKDGEALFLLLLGLAPGRGERRRVAAEGHARDRPGPPEVAQYETREGEKRTVFEIDVDEVGPSLKYATAKVTRAQRSGGGGGYGGGGSRPQRRRRPVGGSRPVAAPRRAAAPRRRPVGGQAGAGGGAPAGRPRWAAPGAGSSDEPPF